LDKCSLLLRQLWASFVIKVEKERGLGPQQEMNYLLLFLSPGPLLTLTKESQELPEEEARINEVWKDVFKSIFRNTAWLA